MSQVTITLPDGSSRSVPAGTPLRDVAVEISPGLARAALAAGYAVVATGRNPVAVAEAVGDADDLLVVRLDVTSRADATRPERCVASGRRTA